MAEEDEHEIRQLIERWAHAVHTGDLDAVLMPDALAADSTKRLRLTIGLRFPIP